MDALRPVSAPDRYFSRRLLLNDPSLFSPAQLRTTCVRFRFGLLRVLQN
jgi:hypothetical protein